MGVYRRITGKHAAEAPHNHRYSLSSCDSEGSENAENLFTPTRPLDIVQAERQVCTPCSPEPYVGSYQTRRPTIHSLMASAGLKLDAEMYGLAAAAAAALPSHLPSRASGHFFRDSDESVFFLDEEYSLLSEKETISHFAEHFGHEALETPVMENVPISNYEQPGRHRHSANQRVHPSNLYTVHQRARPLAELFARNMDDDDEDSCSSYASSRYSQHNANLPVFSPSSCTLPQDFGVQYVRGGSAAQFR